MSIQIRITDGILEDNAKILQNLNISRDYDTNIEIDKIQMTGNTSVLEKLEIGEFVDEPKEKIDNMDARTKECEELKQILRDKSRGKDIKDTVVKHLANFSQGILASLVANWMTK